MMRYSNLSDDQIIQGLAESHSAIATLMKYQHYLATGAGLPKDDAARVELMISNVRLVASIQTEIEALRAELAKRN
jgi:hypothetical protein